MVLVNFVLNGPAIRLLKENTQVRVRTKNGIFQFRPTNRQSELNLPKGERLLDVIRTKRAAYFSVKENFFEIGQRVSIKEDLYGWNSVMFAEDLLQTSKFTAKLTTPDTQKPTITRGLSQTLHIKQD